MRGSHFFSAALLATALAALTPHPAVAVDNCFDCLLGIWDDPGMTANFGTIVPGQPKDIYLGIDSASGFNGLIGIEFSIAGIRQAEDGILVIGVEPIAPAQIVVGSAPAPADTTATSTQFGGMYIGWASCLEGDQALVRITLLAFVSPSNKVLRVLRKYPPAHELVRTPNFVQCDTPVVTQTRVRGGDYIMNWHDAIESTTWSGMKSLFR